MEFLLRIVRRPNSAVAAPALLFALFVAGCHRQTPAAAPAPERPAPSTAIASGPELIRAMHDRYARRWYHTLTFTQRTTTTLASGGDNVQTWHEYLRLPGDLRIDFGAPSEGSGAMYARDSVFIFGEGKLTRADTGMNELLVLGFDAYVQPVARTEEILRRRGFDLSRFHDAIWQGQPVYVVGAGEGDETSRQFWVDKRNLLFVRLLEKTPRGEADFRFNKYVAMDGGWVAAEVEQIVNGKRRVLEEYYDMRTGVPMAPSLFDPREWSTSPKPAGR